MPWFEWFFSGTLTKNDVGFVSDQHIKDIHIPILILHAKVKKMASFEQLLDIKFSECFEIFLRRNYIF